jgi:DeoR family transcriptional regulator, aga operon transcriptional repressor
MMSKATAESNTERQGRLLAWIEERRRASVPEICEQFAVSLATARRDLETLAEQGKVQRVHGGAVAVRRAPPEPPVVQRAGEQVEEKRRIGAAAADLVRDGETIFLGSGTTAVEVAACLHNRRELTVFTNSLAVVNALGHASGVTVTLLGGTVRMSEGSLIGPLTMQALAALRAVRVIMGIRAIDLEEGLTNNYLEESLVDREILRIASETILVADHSKCGRVSIVFVAGLDAVDLLITDDKTPDAFVSALRGRGIAVKVV